MSKKFSQGKNCDLHLHSFYSDGSFSPEELIARAKENEVDCISITDHDNIEAIKQLKKRKPLDCLELIEGVELTTVYKDTEVHILGYFIDSQNEQFAQEIEEARNIRQLRFRQITERLIPQGLNIDKKELLSCLGEVTPTRLHLARYLLRTKQVNSISEAFRRYLEPGRPAYICKAKFSPLGAIELIHSCGGLSFLAHPHQLSNQEWIEQLVSLGLDGLEVSYPTMNKNKSSFYKNYADKKDLLTSGGSDFHGKANTFRKIGCVRAPYSWVLGMEEKRKKEITEQKA